MKELQLNNINKSPVRTWRWLGVNDITIETVVPELKPFKKEIIKEGGRESEVCISLRDKSITFLPVHRGEYSGLMEDYQGVGEGLLEIAKKDFNTGILINTEKGNRANNPVVINFEGDEDNDIIIDNNMIVAEENSEVTVIIQYRDISVNGVFHNGLTEVYGKKGSVVNLIKLQMLGSNSNNFDSNVAYLEEGAKVNFTSIELGAKNTVTNYKTNLQGQGSEGYLNSIYFGDKEKIVDINYVMTHLGKKTQSDMQIRGVLLDKCSKIFRGTLDFKRGASGSKGSEEEYTVLLSPKVRNRAVPLLLCSEEDVQGAHAASAGKVDEDMLFYIMSRGFSEKEAKKLIIEGAFSPIIDKIPQEEIKEEIREFISNNL